MAAESLTGISEAKKRGFWQRARNAVHYRSRNAVSWMVFQTIGRYLNARRLPIMLSHRPDSHYDFKHFPSYAALYGAWVRGNRSNNAGDLTRLYMIVQNCEQVIKDQVPGDFVELGVYKGNSAATLAHFCRSNDRRLFLFDTFAGFDRRDLKGIDSKAHDEFADTSLEGVKNLVGTEAVTYVQGFFPGSCDGVELPRQIAVAHIDCDLHDPMRAALDMFYPRMAPGGLIIMHDYSSGHWIGATKAIDDFFADKPERPILIPDKSGTAVVRMAAVRGR